MKIEKLKYVYLVGIGGIGMSALARYFKHLGCVVAGYDKTETELTKALVKEGIAITYIDLISRIAETFKTNLNEEMAIIYTPAIPKDSSILNYFKNQKFEMFKRSEVLGLIASNYKTIAIAGTHGKTTTTTLTSHLVSSILGNCHAFLGGISTNFNSNLILSNYAKYCIVEADEFDRSFLTLNPEISVITSTDADHLDIYGNANSLTDTYSLFAKRLSASGTLIAHANANIRTGGINKVLRYNIEKKDGIQIWAENIKVVNGSFEFDYISPLGNLEGVRLNVPGRHNVENTLAAITIALLLHAEKERIKKSIASFTGVKRRFEYIIKTEKLVYIDDYAHHPTEIEAFVNALKEVYPNKKITGIFQPHLYSRTRDFMQGFADSLGKLDEVVLMNIYPARELPIEGISSQALLEMIPNKNKYLVDDKNLIEFIKNRDTEILATIGAGDIDKQILPIKNTLIEKYRV